MPKVFISHSSLDREFVEREIITPLRTSGIETWYSTDNIRTAEAWEKSIRDGLKSCDWFLVVMSPNSVASRWVQREVHWAMERREGRVIPVLIEACDPEDLHLGLFPIQHIDFRQNIKGAQKKLLAIWDINKETKPTSPAPEIKPIADTGIEQGAKQNPDGQYESANEIKKELRAATEIQSNNTGLKTPTLIQRGAEFTDTQARKSLYFVVAAAASGLLAVITVSYWLSSAPLTNPSSSNTTATNTQTTATPMTAILANTLIPFRKGDKFGFSDVNKNIVIEPKYDFVSRFNDGIASVAQIVGERSMESIKTVKDMEYIKVGFIDKTGKEVIPLKYDIPSLLSFSDYKQQDSGLSVSEGLLCLSLNSKFGFIDKTGKEVIPFKYDGADSFQEGLARVILNGKFGFIDKTGKEVIPLKFDMAWSFSEGLARVGLNEKYGFIDRQGNVVILLKYDHDYDALSFSEGLARVKLNGKFGFIDKTGREVIPLRYDSAWTFSEGLVSVKLNNKWGFIDKTGKEVIPFKYDKADQIDPSFSEGLARVIINDKYGFIDKTGKEIIPFKYEDAKWFSEGLARVKLNGKFGFIDTTGKEVIPFKYDAADPFKGGISSVAVNGKMFYIDKNGTEYFEP